MSEAQTTSSIRALLNSQGIFHWKQWQGPMSQPKGVSDLLGIFKGRMLAIEVKRPNWKPPQPGSKQYKHYYEQERFLESVKNNGGIAFFATSVDDVIDGLGIRDRFLF